MRITIHGQRVAIDHSQREHIRRRLQFALSRFPTRVREVVVRLADINGDRGGVGHHCRISVHLNPTGTVMIEDIDAVALVAVDRAADRLGRTVARELRRRWEVRRRPASREYVPPIGRRTELKALSGGY